MPDVNADQRRSSTNSALGYSFLVVPLLVFLVLLTNKLDKTVKISYFAATSPLFLTFFTLIITSFGTRGGKPFISIIASCLLEILTLKKALVCHNDCIINFPHFQEISIGLV